MIYDLARYPEIPADIFRVFPRARRGGFICKVLIAHSRALRILGGSNGLPRLPCAFECRTAGSPRMVGKFM